MSSVIGENSNSEYSILKEIGRGAQGRVFSIKGGSFAFKFLGKKNSIKSQVLKRKLSYIKTRNIQDLPISKPIELVKGETLGYIMEMAIGMIPLESLLKPTFESNWWSKTGGLEKRLKILTNLSDVLSKLHSRGLIYGDLSPSNIFVSENPSYTEIFLIDCDNITHESKVGEAYYTPGYGAPEIINKKSGSTTYSEYYSFAVIAYQLLTLNHPFIGDYVNNGDPELEEKAYLCEIPWVEHTKNDMNTSSSGLNSDITVSKLLKDEFITTFEYGIEDKFKRTSMLKWNEVLQKTNNYLINCSNCSNNYLYKKFKTPICPYCNIQEEFIGLLSILSLNYTITTILENNYDISLEDLPILGKEIERFIINKNKSILISEDNLFLNGSLTNLLEIRIESEFLFIKKKSDNITSIVIYNEDTNKAKIVNLDNEIKIAYGNFFIFSNEQKSDYKRVLKIGKYPR